MIILPSSQGVCTMSGDTPLLIGISVDADSAAQAAAAVRSDCIKPIGAAFAKNVIRVRNTLSMPRATTEALLNILGFGIGLWKTWQSSEVRQGVQETLAQLMSKAQGGVVICQEDVKAFHPYFEKIWEEFNALQPHLTNSALLAIVLTSLQ
jgi:hypothetical protein